MNTEARAFHLYFSIYRDIVANDEKAKLITTKIVDEIIESHLHKYNPENISETLKYWIEVKSKINKL